MTRKAKANDVNNATVEVSATQQTSASDTKPLRANPFENAVRDGVDLRSLKIVLFNYMPEERDPLKEYPVMTGLIEGRDFKIRMAGFKKMTKDGKVYLSVRMGDEGQIPVFGSIFREEGEGKDGYFGYITRSVKTNELDEDNKAVYADEWKVGLKGRKRKSNEGLPFWQGSVYRLNDIDTDEATNSDLNF